jgi:ATP phosphoribosyltransferase regulatory subunit HisZ
VARGVSTEQELVQRAVFGRSVFGVRRHGLLELAQAGIEVVGMFKRTCKGMLEIMAWPLRSA